MAAVRQGDEGVVIRFARWVIKSHAVWLVALADLGGAAAGYIYWYGSTILAAPWYYWIFIPDCPLAAMLMGIVLLALHFGRRWEILGILAAGTCIKYGLWTMYFWTFNFSAGAPVSFEGVIMALTHFLMLVQGVLLSFFLRYRWLPVVIAFLYLVGNDLADYVAGHYPSLPGLVGVGMMRNVAVIMTAVLVVSWTATTWVRARRGYSGDLLKGPGY